MELWAGTDRGMSGSYAVDNHRRRSFRNYTFLDKNAQEVRTIVGAELSLHVFDVKMHRVFCSIKRESDIGIRKPQ